jgi:hypothetical protein
MKGFWQFVLGVGMSGVSEVFEPRYRLQAPAVNARIEHVEAVVVADGVVHLLGLYTAAEIDLGIDHALVIDERLANDAAVGTDDARAGAALVGQQFARLGVAFSIARMIS